MLVSIGVAVVVALCLPVWASVSITVGAVLIAAAGGGALLAKVAAAGAVLLLVAGYWRRHAARRREAQSGRTTVLLAIPEPQAPRTPAPRREQERRAA